MGKFHFSWSTFALILTTAISAKADFELSGLVRCARELNNITTGSVNQEGLFSEEQIVFFSSTDHLASALKKGDFLWVFTDVGIYSFHLPQQTQQKITFSIPDVDSRRSPVTYTMRYFHSEIRSSQYFDFIAESTPTPKESVQVLFPLKVDANKGKAELLNAIRRKLDGMILSVNQNKVSRSDLMMGNLGFCKNLSSRDEEINISIHRSLDRLDTMSPREGARMPASL